MLIIPCVS